MSTGDGHDQSTTAGEETTASESVASLGWVTPGAATEGVTRLFFS